MNKNCALKLLNEIILHLIILTNLSELYASALNLNTDTDVAQASQLCKQHVQFLCSLDVVSLLHKNGSYNVFSTFQSSWLICPTHLPSMRNIIYHNICYFIGGWIHIPKYVCFIFRQHHIMHLYKLNSHFKRICTQD
jgi:hypothetical protein